MKILFVTPYLPSPPRGGAQRRLDGLMRGLAERHDVSLLSFRENDGNSSAAEATALSYCQNVATLANDVLYMDLRAKRLRQLRSLGSRHSFEYQQLQHPQLQPTLDRMLLRQQYDIVQVEFSHLGFLRFPPSAGRSTRFVLDEHNIEFDVIRRTAALASTALRLAYAQVNWRKLHREELAAWRRFDGISLVSERDQQLLHREVPRARTAVVPNAVDLDAFRPGVVPAEPNSLVFIGAMNYQPNVDGITHFLDQIFPRIQALAPGVRLSIVGPNPAESVVARKSDVIDVTGFVDDPRPYVDRAAVMVVPLRIGGGTRFKIVEGMAQGKAIVSTHLGAEGLGVVHGEHLLLADSPEDFARQVHRLLSDPSLSARLGLAARKLAEERFGWPSAVSTLERFYGELLAS